MKKSSFFHFSELLIFRSIREFCFVFVLLFFVAYSTFAQANQPGMYKTGNGRNSASSIVIHQEADFAVSPQRVYQALLSSKEFSECIKKSFPDFTTNNATIEPSIGGSFSLFDGHIIGRILEWRQINGS